MDLALHLRVLWRSRLLLAAGLLLGIVLAVLAAYSVTFAGTPKLTPREAQEWTSSSELLVTQAGFPWGRVTLPGTVAPGEPTPPLPKPEKGGEAALVFGAPNRFSTLASLYAVISLSDQARRRLPGQILPSQIQALPRSLEGAGGIVLPIVVILTKDSTKPKARQLNVDAVAALRDFLREEQEKAKIPPIQRVTLQTLNAPSAGKLTVGRSYTVSILAFILCLVCTVAWVHILQNLRESSSRRGPRRRAGHEHQPAADVQRAAGPPHTVG